MVGLSERILVEIMRIKEVQRSNHVAQIFALLLDIIRFSWQVVASEIMKVTSDITGRQHFLTTLLLFQVKKGSYGFLKTWKVLQCSFLDLQSHGILLAVMERPGKL